MKRFKPKLLFSLSFIILHFATFPTESTGAIDYQEIKNKDGETVYIVLNERWIKVPNRHRKPNHPSMKLSITGSKIESVETKSSIKWTLHLSDKTTVDFTVEEKQNATEYNFLWHGRGSNENREVCFYYGADGTNWYSAYQSFDQKWPMDITRKVGRTNFNHNTEYDFLNNIGEFYQILEHLFVNTDGFSLILNSAQPWFIRRDPNPDDLALCFSVNNSAPYSANIVDPNFKNIDFKLFSLSDVRSVTEYVHKNVIPKPSSLPNERKFTHFSVFYSSTNEVIKYSQEILKRGFKNFDLILNEWEKSRGDLTFDSTSKPNSDVAISELIKMNIGTILEMRPYVNNLVHPATHQYMLKDNATQLTHYLDFTNTKACDWFESMLKKLYFEEDINQFHLFEDAFTNFRMHNESEPNLYIQNFISTVSRVGAVSSYLAFRTQQLPMVVVPIFHTQVDNTQILRMLIPNALSISMAGYSFFSSYSIGRGLPEKNRDEIYIRWVQAASLLPCMQFNYLPMNFANQTVELTKKFINLHSDHVATIIELAKKRMTDGTPIIRPMWYAEPNNPATYKINDQYMLGDDIVVAPVLMVGQHERNVYLPPGEWLDQHGKSYKGSGEFKVKAPLEDLPYFKRKFGKF